MFERSWETSATPQVVVRSCLGNLRVRAETDQKLILVVEEKEDEVRIERDGETFSLRIPADGTLVCPSGTRLTVEEVFGNLHVGGLEGELTIATVHGNATLHDVADVSFRETLGNLQARSIAGNLTGEDLKGNGRISEVTGRLTLGEVRGNLVGENLRGGLEAGRVRGNVRLAPYFAPGAIYRVEASGNLDILLSPEPDVSLTLRAKGRMWSQVAGLDLERTESQATATLGSGEAAIEATVQGNITLRPAWAEEVFSTETHLEDLGATIERRVNEKMAELATRLETTLGGFKGEPIQRRVEMAADRARREAEHAAERARMRAERAERRWQRASGEGARPEPETVTKEEQLRVLRMVEEGRLTPDEAAELLSALEGS